MDALRFMLPALLLGAYGIHRVGRWSPGSSAFATARLVVLTALFLLWCAIAVPLGIGGSLPAPWNVIIVALATAGLLGVVGLEALAHPHRLKRRAALTITR